jgi:hypothetical protein
MSHDESEVKAWRCGGGHVLGWVVRRNRVRVLLLLREALEGRPQGRATRCGESGQQGGEVLEGERGARELGGSPLRSDGEGGEVDVMAVVEGYVADVRCSVCGRVRTWVPGQEAVRKMLRQAER